MPPRRGLEGREQGRGEGFSTVSPPVTVEMSLVTSITYEFFLKCSIKSACLGLPWGAGKEQGESRHEEAWAVTREWGRPRLPSSHGLFQKAPWWNAVQKVLRRLWTGRPVPQHPPLKANLRVSQRGISSTTAAPTQKDPQMSGAEKLSIFPSC